MELSLSLQDRKSKSLPLLSLSYGDEGTSLSLINGNVENTKATEQNPEYNYLVDSSTFYGFHNGAHS